MSSPGTGLATVASTLAALRAQAASQRSQVEAAADPAQRAAALGAVAATRGQIQATLGTIQPADLVAGVDPHVPLALLPVRLETRFADPGIDVLHVRIFPDDIHVDAHDPSLTAAEATLGAALWSAASDLLAEGEAPPAVAPAPDLVDGRRARWARLIRQLGGPRAAWVAHATRPGSTPAATKQNAYVSPPVARALPDRWLVRAYVGTTVVGEAWTLPVQGNLHLAPDPQSVPTTDTSGATLPPVDPELRWLVDYPSAVAAGMAVDVALPSGTNDLDRVVAIGVRATTAAADAASELGSLLAAHRYTDGFGILPTGSPTSNTPAARSARDRLPDPDELWAEEFGAPSAAAAAGPTLARALGVDESVVDGIASSGGTDDAHARAMQTALWPATWGYYLTDLIDQSALQSVDVDAVRTHYLEFVRGRGAMPVVRLGRQPYGVLPLLTLGSWNADGASTTVGGLVSLLQRARPLWRYGVAAPVTASTGPDFDAAFTRVMSTDAVARGYSVRSSLADRSVDPGYFAGVNTTSATAVIDALVGGLLTGENPLILDVFSPTSQPVRAPLVVDPRDPTPDATVQAAIRGLTGTSPLHILQDAVWLTPSAGGPATVLHTLLRRSLLLEYGRTGVSVAAAQVTTTAAAAPAPANASARVVASAGMLGGLTPSPAGGFVQIVSLPEVMSSQAPGAASGVAMGDWLWQNPTLHPELRGHLDETLAALGVLSGLTAAELELLLPEALDLATHRWTAWAESVATDKLARLRTATPTGVALGGWGLVDRLSRRARTSVDPSLAHGAADGPVWADTRPGGFVHAPSSAQATTAAVLRAAHLAHGGEDDATCAVDLSSGPARTAVRLAAGVRAGQELGALLGYELELDLHERSADVLIAPLRAYAPRWKASGTFVEGDPEEIVSPSAVVDGLAVADADPADVAQKVLPPGADADLTAALSGALDTLHDHLHALADLFTAEAVHQTLLGNSSRAGAALDAASRGGMPPDDYDVLRTPRNGATLTCRIAVLLPPAPAGPFAGGWPACPRSTADADCSAMLAALLPPVSRVRLRVTTAAGPTSDVPLPPAAELGPLDVVVDRPDAVRTRILLALSPGSTIVDGRDPAWSADTIGLDELLTAASDLREVLAARPLRSLDLLAPGTTEPTTDERDAADLRQRLSAARSQLQAAATSVAAALTPLSAPDAPAQPDLTAARTAVASALALGLTLSLADPGAREDLVVALQSAETELTRRLALQDPAADATVDDVAAGLQALLGASQPAVPRLELDADASGALTTGLAAGDSLLATTPELASEWLDDVAGVRVGAQRLAAALQDCEALSAGRGLAGALRIAEPAASASTWSALLGADDLAARAPAYSLVAWAAGPVTAPAGGRLAGLLVDEWVEVAPAQVAATSIAYQAEAPPARAPQAVLLGLVPEVAAGWNVEAVVDLVLEAADLAGLREVDLERGAWLGRLLPAIFLPDGNATDVIAAPPLPLLQVDGAVLASARAQTKELG